MSGQTRTIRTACTSSPAFVALLIGIVGTAGGVASAQNAGQSGGQSAQPAAPSTYPLVGIVRDFRPGHPDFAPGAADRLGYSVGNIASTLGRNGTPEYIGRGMAVRSEARDAQGRPIAPSMVKAEPITDFSISDARITSGRPMAAKVTVIGSAITYGGTYDMAVTTAVHAGGNALAPFGSFDAAVGGNVNDGSTGRHVVLPGLVQTGGAISIDARSWTRRDARNASLLDSDWQTFMTVNSGSGGRNVVALRNGDRAPAVEGFMGQVAAKDMLTPYINASTQRITLRDNQVIYLFELGTSNTSSSAFDLQDLVVLVDLATDPSYFEEPPAASPCLTIRDTRAELGASDTGGISGAASFAQWFTNSPGNNASDRLVLTMTRGGDGTYSYATPDFHPIDGELYGNQGAAHNRGFTFVVDASCTYQGCGRQFFEYDGDGDAWLFVNGALVMDMGGFHPNSRQFVDFDRLGLTAGSTARVQFFYAERAESSAAFAIRTNIVLDSRVHSVGMPGVSALHD